ncbi:serine hydrolase domain-containing protein, partial [Pseudomonas aeruginosa]|uniref:serine hydrolase domain-containing protein n=1 Tax=Pseudomonas aeruginosa TaxID=287 RepID=UPI0039B95C22
WQRDTLVNAYCVIKPVTAVAALMLVEEGRLGLDVPVCAYWPAPGPGRWWVGGVVARMV